MHDAARERENDATLERAKAAAEEQADDAKVSVNLPQPLHSAYYILLRLPQDGNGFEGKESWMDLPATPADARLKPYLHNRIMMEKGPDERIFPASMTKILTALTVLEHIPDLNRKITISDKNFHYYYADGAAIAGYRAGDTASLLDLLYGLMLLSGSECASVLAEETAGGEEAFAALMNGKAAEIGMTSSHFTNPVGLHNEENYSTVSDIAVLLDYALQNRTFAEIFTSELYTAAPVGSHPDGLTMRNHIFRDEESEPEASTPGGTAAPDSDTGSLLGGKTGFLDEAGQCLASLLSKGDVRFILVTAAAMPRNARTQSLHIDDMRTVLGSIKVFPAS
ncbi:MAG: serine hydrolase [Clostridiales Family XIII bacterium]|nr:serine hydrolase [Clostridiales Family XIII bacterium]